MSASGSRPVIPADESGHHPPNGWIVAVNGRSGGDGLTAKTRHQRTSIYSPPPTFTQRDRASFRSRTNLRGPISHAKPSTLVLISFDWSASTLCPLAKRDDFKVLMTENVAEI